MNVVIPSLFMAVSLALILRDALEEWNLPDYPFIGAGVAIFIAMFLFMTVKETTDKKTQ